MTKLSVNINKIALIRNSRGENLPNLKQVAMDCEEFGAEGITVHPRPDERHIRYSDITILKDCVQTELNIEGYPSERFLDLVCKNKPHQCTLVPDPPGVLTSSSGWDTIQNKAFLTDIIKRLKDEGVRVSLFLNAEKEQVRGAKAVGTDRIEFYTGKYARNYFINKEEAVKDHVLCAQLGHDLGLGINAGHDLNQDNLKYYKDALPYLDEVSIGHALISDAIYVGLKNSIQLYLARLK